MVPPCLTRIPAGRCSVVVPTISKLQNTVDGFFFFRLRPVQCVFSSNFPSPSHSGRQHRCALNQRTRLDIENGIVFPHNRRNRGFLVNAFRPSALKRGKGRNGFGTYETRSLLRRSWWMWMSRSVLREMMQSRFSVETRMRGTRGVNISNRSASCNH